MTHLLGITAATAGIILCTLLPFLPGRYDTLAVPLSMIAQLLGKVGLLLVPVGALWMASRYWSRLAGRQYVVAIGALIAALLVWVILLVGALMSSLLLGVGALALSAYAVVRMSPRLRLLTSATPRPPSALPLYMLIVPIAVAILQVVLAGPATEFSRSRAIRNSAPLIADIEQYRAVHGRYPTSLLSVWPDYSPTIIGISEYHYEPSGDAYNLFEQGTFQLGTREFVMYNPRDQQVMTSHKMDLLQLTPAQLALDQTRGHYAVHDAPHPHWKYFWFD